MSSVKKTSSEMNTANPSQAAAASSSSILSPSSNLLVTPSPSQKSLGYIIASGLPIGFLFGTALEKSKVFLPPVIQGQMSMDTFIMLKVFLVATASGMIVTSSLEKFGYIKRSAKANSLGLGMLGGYGGNALGGLLLGAGIYVAGSCPGTVFPQLAAGSPLAYYTLAGSFVGVYAFSFLHKILKKRNPSFLLQKESSFIDKQLGNTALKVSSAMAVALSAIVYLTESTFPWQEEVSKYIVGFNPATDGQVSFSLFAKVWHPVVSGLVIGLLQLPSYLLMGVALGTSSSYVAMAANVDKIVSKNNSFFPYFNSFKNNSDFYQISLVTGMIVGAITSRYLSGVSYVGLTQGLTPASAFLGGVCLLAGARLAGGCTSGHGISGMARLATSSVITAAAMFAGGMAMAYITKFI